MRDDTRAVALMSVTAGYYALIEYVDLYPWNNLRNGSGQEKLDPVVLAAQGLLITGTVKDARWARAANLTAYTGWLGLQAVSWWIPYFRGAPEKLQERYDRYFGSTVKFLPRIGGRPWVPDAAHVVLQALVAACLVASGRRVSRRDRMETIPGARSNGGRGKRLAC